MASNVIIYWPYTTKQTFQSVTVNQETESGDLKPVDFPPCDFCEGKTTGSTYDMETQGKRWNICSEPRCWKAAHNQKDRVYNGLVDCLQTRKDVLRWTDQLNGKKK